MNQPAGYTYQDGCDVASHCVDCPLTECRYVDPGPYREYLKVQRRSQFLAYRNEHPKATVAEVAGKFGVSKSTVRRVVKSREG